jgi:hypothetical protein
LSGGGCLNPGWQRGVRHTSRDITKITARHDRSGRGAHLACRRRAAAAGQPGLRSRTRWLRSRRQLTGPPDNPPCRVGHIGRESRNDPDPGPRAAGPGYQVRRLPALDIDAAAEACSGAGSVTARISAYRISAYRNSAMSPPRCSCDSVPLKGADHSPSGARRSPFPGRPSSLHRPTGTCCPTGGRPHVRYHRGRGRRRVGAVRQGLSAPPRPRIRVQLVPPRRRLGPTPSVELLSCAGRNP